ncbi:MAG: hypothetical protein ABW042_09095 [Phenylobacterium sp.]
MSVENTRPRDGLRIPKDLMAIVGFAAAIAAAVWLGGLLAAVIPASQASVWLKAGAFAAPAAAMFALYWLITQRL